MLFVGVVLLDMQVGIIVCHCVVGIGNVRALVALLNSDRSVNC